jgi:hypothetical protein
MVSVLVAVPYRDTTPVVFVEKTCEHFARMTFPCKQLALVPNAFAKEQRKYGPNARARNHLIDTCLCDSHTHVLWLDVDLVDVPADLIGRLLDISTDDIVAPFVFMETLDASKPASFDNGGWFYDTGGFIQNGEDAKATAPHFKGDTRLMELDSVGCCYIAPAWLYRDGLRYRPNGDDVEHKSFMQSARDRGVKVLATDTIEVKHAYLPRYGEGWHHE